MATIHYVYVCLPLGGADEIKFSMSKATGIHLLSYEYTNEVWNHSL